MREMRRSAESRQRIVVALHGLKRSLLDHPCSACRRNQLEKELDALDAGIQALTQPEVQAREKAALLEARRIAREEAAERRMLEQELELVK